MDEEFQSETQIEIVDIRPLVERIVDKNWKTRNTAYEDLKIKLLSQSEEDNLSFAEYGQFLSKMTSDANAGAMDSGFDTAIVFADQAPLSIVVQYSDGLYKNAVDKAFNARQSTITKGKHLLLKLMEIDEPTSCVTFLMSKMTDKKPKVPATCLEVIREGVIMFGLRPFPVKDIVKGLKVVFDGSNAPAKEAAMVLIVEIFRWIGLAPLQALLDSIKPVQKAEFEKIIGEKEEEFSRTTTIPTLYLRKSRPAPGSEIAEEGQGSSKKIGKKGGMASGATGMDGREFVDEVDLPKKLRATEFATLVAEEKWSEQLKGLQLVIDAIGPVPKIKAGSDVHDVVAVCKGFLRQGHVLLQVSSLKILALLADGLRSDFSSTVRPMLQTVLQKSKEKRLVPDVQACLHVVLSHCVTFDTLTDEVVELIRNKKNPPHCKIGVMDFMCTVLAEMPEKVGVDSMKPLAEALISICEDPDPKVRDTCAVTLAALAPVVKGRGKVSLDAYRALMALEQSTPRVFKKMQNAMETGSASEGGSAKSTNGPGVKAATTATISSTTAEDGIDVPLRPKPSAVGPTKKPSVSVGSSGSSKTVSSLASSIPGKKSSIASSSTSSTTGGGAAKKGSSVAKDTAEDDNVEDLSMSPEEATAVLEGLGVDGWDSLIQTNMTSSKWQDKVEALGSIERRIVETKTGGQYSAALVKYLSVQTGGFKISNANILKAVIQTACAAATNCGDAKFSKPAAWELLRQFGDKLSDRKTKEVVETLLTALSENISPSFVVKRMRVVMDKIKSPVAHQYFLEWLKQAVQDFGCAVFPVPHVGAFCQMEMDNKIAAVRSAAVEVMGALYHQIGPKLLVIAISDDMKPALKALLEAEFAKVGHDPAAAAKATRAVNGEAGGAGAGVAIPRQDLSALVDKNILGELGLLEGKTSWMNRKAAMEALTAACERSGHYLEANKSTGEIVKALKVRIADTQANLKPLAVTAIGHIVASLELESANKVLKIIASGMMAGLADNKKSMRDATVAALHLAVTFNRQPQESALADTLMLASLLPSICESLTNVVGRQELLAWLLQNAESLKSDCGDLTASLVIALQDKTAAVRALSEQLLTALMSRSLISKVQLDKATRDLPPATKRGLDKTIAALMACFGSSVAATKKLSATPVIAIEESVVEDDSSQNEDEEQQQEDMYAPPVVEHVPVVRHASSFRHHPELVSHRPAETTSESVPIVKRSGLMAPRAGSAKVLVTASAPDLRTVPPSHPVVVKTQVHSALAAAAAAVSDDEEEEEEGDSRWFLKRTSVGKSRRLEDFPRLNWPQPPEGPGEHEYVQLKATWEPLLTSDLAYLMFPANQYSHDAFVCSINELRSQMDCPFFYQHLDLVLRWCCCALYAKESVNGLVGLLGFVSDIFLAIRENNPANKSELLHESEIMSILPHLIDKCGHLSQRPRIAFQKAIDSASEIISPTKITKLLLHGLHSTNKLSRVRCIEELEKIVKNTGVVAMGKNGMRDVARFVDSAECDQVSFTTALNLIFLVYTQQGSDFSKLRRLMGEMSPLNVSKVEDRIKEKAKYATSGSDAPSSQVKHHLHPSPFSREKGPTNTSIAAVSVDHAQLLQQIDDVMVSTPIKPTPSKGPFVPLPLEKSTTVEKLGENHPSAAFRSPAVKLSRQSMIPIASPGGVAGEFESLYVDIGRKMDRLLSSSGVLSDNDVVHEEAKDYIKMLHSVVSGEWSLPEERTVDDDIVMLSHVDGLAKQLVHCVGRSFDQPAAMLNKVPGTFLGIDVSLVAISLSTLFAMVKRTDIARQLSEETLFDIFYECLLRLCDPRILHPHTSDPESIQTAQQIVTAINMVVVKLAVEGHTSMVLCVLLRIMFQCIPTSEVSLHVAKSRREMSPLPSACTKPTSRLVIKVLTDETEKEDPYMGDINSPFDMKALLLTIHLFFSRHPANTTDDTPFRTVKTVLNEVIKARGGQQILSALQGCEEIGHTAFIYLLTSRLGNVSLQSETDGDLHAQIVSIIENITHVRDKRAAIRELHAIKVAHPSLDFNVYLNQISSTFRRFVLDTLAQLDAGENGLGDFPTDENEQRREYNQFADPHDSTRKTSDLPRSGQQVDGSNSVASGVTQNKADEAMRILEGLKNRPNYYKQLHSAGGEERSPGAEGSVSTPSGKARRGGNNTQQDSDSGQFDSDSSPRASSSGRKSLDSPFAKRNDKIRDSLSNLTASLDLPGGASEAAVTPTVFDSDLSARLQRLRNMDMKS